MPRLPLAIQLPGVTFEQALRSLSRLPGFFCIDTPKARRRGRRISVLSALPKGSFSFAGAFVTSDGHTSIENPLAALSRFAARATRLPSDPYLPFSGGIAGYVGFEGARAIGGLNPARGFSRHSQCRMGLYHAALIFDHAEGTSTLAATGSTTQEAESAAGRLNDALSEAPEETDEAPGPAPSEGELRAWPSAERMREMISTARLWLRAERATRIHLVRHMQRPSSCRDFALDFLTASAGNVTRAAFAHEGSVQTASSHGSILALDGRRLSLELAMRGGRRAPLKMHRHIASDMASAISRLCDEWRATGAGETHGRPGGASTVFEGRLSREMCGVDALAGLLPAHPLTGSPHPAALNFIDMNEELHRGLYGGAFGTMDSSGLCFSMADEVSTSADGALGTTVGMDLTEESDDETVLSGFEELLSRLPHRTG